MNRITQNPEQMGGAPCIRGLRIPVETVVNLVTGGMTAAEISADYPDLEREDIVAALRYRHAALCEEINEDATPFRESPNLVACAERDRLWERIEELEIIHHQRQSGED